MSDFTLRALTRAECISLLESRTLGQLALTRRALPTIVPAHYLVADNTVLVHASTGIDRVPWLDGEIVALHVQEFDEDLRTGWSVSVTGAAHGTPGVPAELDRLQAPWIRAGGGDLIAVSTDIVWGERLGETSESAPTEVSSEEMSPAGGSGVS